MDKECPYIQRKRAGDETYDICEINTKSCLIEHGLYECETWNEIRKEEIWQSVKTTRRD